MQLCVQLARWRQAVLNMEIEPVVDRIHELYGLAFLALGAVSQLLSRRDPSLKFVKRLPWLSAFAYAYGLMALANAWRLGALISSANWEWVRLGLLLSSYLALLEFGRLNCAGRALTRPAWVHASAGCAALLATAILRDPFAGVRWTVGLPAAVLTASALWTSTDHTDARMRAWIRTGSAAFVIFGLSTSLANHVDVDGVFELVRSACAITVALALAQYVLRSGAITAADLTRLLGTLEGVVYRGLNDRQRSMLYMTGGVEALCGFGAGQFVRERTQSWAALITPPEDRERVWSELQAAIVARRDYVLSYRIAARSGELHWVYERGRAVFDASGAVRFLDGYVMDDNARMQALTELRLKNMAMDSSLNGISMLDPAGCFQYLNRACVDLLGLQSAEHALGRSALELCVDLAMGEEVLQTIMRDGAWRGTIGLRRADGATVDVQAASQRIDPGLVMTSFVDISEQTRLAEELRRERDFAQGLIATAPVIILLLDAQGRIQHLNPHAEALLGYTLDELRGESWCARLLAESQNEGAEAVFVAANGGSEARAQVFALFTRAREKREIEWTTQPMYDAHGAVTGVLAVGLDVTERKAAHEALRASREQLRGVLDALSSFVGVYDLDGTIVDVNRVPLEAIGLPREQVVGRPVWELPVFKEPKHGEAMLRESIARASRGEVVREDLTMDLTNGRHIVLDAAYSPVRDAQGTITRVVGCAIDVTEQRALEVQRLELQEQLRQSQKLEALGTLAGGIAHDLNNVLTAIFGNIMLLRRKPEPELASECLTEIERAGQRAHDLVRRILAFSRRQDQALTHVDVVSIVQETLKLLRSTLPTRVDLQLVADPNERFIAMADASQLHQVLMNLATNAWHALEDRPGTLTFSVSNTWLDGDGSRALEIASGNYVHVVVRDTGSGMSAPVLERVFEPFFTTKPAGQGTGLGLSMVHGVMKAHRGTVRIESRPGAGTSVHLYFPPAPATFASESRPAEPQRALRGAGERVLFVDDERPLIEIAVRALGALNYRVTGMLNAEQALAAVRAAPRAFDIVVTDHNMPGASGIELAQTLAEISPGTPVLLVSGYLREDELQRAIDVGVAEVVMKPVTYEHLSVRIRGLLDRARARRAEPNSARAFNA